MNQTPVLLHENDEFIKANIYLDGIGIYKKLLRQLADLWNDFNTQKNELIDIFDNFIPKFLQKQVFQFDDNDFQLKGQLRLSILCLCMVLELNGRNYENSSMRVKEITKYLNIIAMFMSFIDFNKKKRGSWEKYW